MKKLTLVLIFCLATIATKAQGGDVKGAWTGKLNVYGTELTLVFHLDSVNCTLDSPDQGIKGARVRGDRHLGYSSLIPKYLRLHS